MNKRQPETETHKIPIPWRIYTVIGLITLMVVGSMAFILQKTNNICMTHDPLLVRISDMQLKVTTAHLWFEELLSGDRVENIETVRALLSYTEESLHALTDKKLHSDEHVRSNVPNNTREDYGRLNLSHALYNIREPLKVVDEKMDELIDVLEKKHRAMHTYDPVTGIDQHFDRIFVEFHEEMGEIVKKIRNSKANHLAEFKIIQTSLIIICLVLAVFVTVIFQLFERRKAEDLLDVMRSEESLRESGATVRSIFRAAPTGIGMVSGRVITQANERLCEILGYSKDELLGQGARMVYLSDEDFDYVGREKYTQIRDKGTGTVETRWQRKDGKVIDVLLSSTPIDPGDLSIGVTFTALDITDRKHTEEALRESEEKYRLLFENANEAIFIIEDGIVKFPNFKTEEMTGYSEKELSEIPFINIIHPGDREMVLERRRKRLLGEKPPTTYSFRMINNYGDELLVQINAVLITWAGKPATLNFIRDITEQKRLEAQLQQAQKMESMGTLAGGIAHDFNNLLMGIQGSASLLQMDIDSSNPHFKLLKGIDDYVKSAADLTKQLLGFARGGKYEVKTTDLNKFIKKQNCMFGRARKEINIRGRYEKNLWTVDVDQGQIEQVLLNIYVNAWKAMPGGGNLYIQTENIVIDESYNRSYNVEPGKYVKISVADTGVGMDKVTQQRIFEPFFTTREMERGTGLGLASAYGIVKNHDGFINVYSEKGKGTIFNIYFPASEKEIVKEKKILEEVIKGTETVLLVDDEDMIIDVGQDILQSLGYEVLPARGGEEALQVYKKNQYKIDMVILDMIMPDMGGSDTYDRLKEINPVTKVLLSSGYSINGQATEILKRGCDGFIQKPFNMIDLSKRIREILDKD